MKKIVHVQPKLMGTRPVFNLLCSVIFTAGILFVFSFLGGGGDGRLTVHAIRQSGVDHLKTGSMKIDLR